MTYLYQAIRAWLADWIAPKWAALRGALTWAALKTKAASVWNKLINTEGK